MTPLYSVIIQWKRGGTPTVAEVQAGLAHRNPEPEDPENGAWLISLTPGEDGKLNDQGVLEFTDGEFSINVELP